MATLRPWRRVARTRVHDCRVFELGRVRFAPPEGAEADFYVVDAPDWINVVALTEDEHAVFVRQYRFGVEGFTLEIPGGMCDPGEDPRAAAARELHEETGYRCRSMVPLGWVHPNPAIQSNRCHTFLARGLLLDGEPSPDEHEAFEVELHPLSDVPALVRSGVVTHSLVVAAFHLFALGRDLGRDDER